MQDRILNNLLVLNKEVLIEEYCPNDWLRFLNNIIRPQHSKKTIPILSIQGKAGQRIFSKAENTNEPNAAESAPFAVALR